MLDLRAVRIDGKPIESCREAIVAAQEIVRGTIVHPARLEKREERKQREHEEAAKASQEAGRATLKRRSPEGEKRRDSTPRRQRSPLLQRRKIRTPPRKRVVSVSRCSKGKRSFKLHPRDSPEARTRSSSFSQSRLRAKRGEPPARGRSSAEKRSDRRSDREDRREREQRDIERSRYTSKKELTSQEEEIKRKKEHAAALQAKFLRLKKEVADGQRQLEASREKKRLERKRLEKQQKEEEEEKKKIFEAVASAARETTERVAAVLVGAPPPPLNAPRSDIPTPPEPVKTEMDAPYIEQLGPINWGAVPEREREQLRLACVLIVSLQERVAEIEGDKTLLMNMMAQDRARALRGQASSSGAASSSSAPPLQSLGRFPPPPPSGPSGPHQ